MSRRVTCTILHAPLVLLITAAVGVAQDETKPATNTLQSALKDGKAWVKFRPRYEFVDQTGLGSKAYAGTIRSVLGYETGAYKGFRGLLEFEAVSVVGDDGYNDTLNGKSSRPVIADPASAEVNQSYIQYDHDKFQFRGGRQRIVLGNHRFVGNVGWRQNEQTFDAVSAKAKDLGGVDVFYAFVNNANRIFSDNHPAGDHRMESHLLNVERDVGPVGRVTAYYYGLDYDSAAALSTVTFGARLTGKRKLGQRDGAMTMSWAAEYANQTDTGNNPNQVDADYINVEVGLGAKKWSAAVGLETLEGDGATNVFSTPLATGHKFNGWADKFLATPAGGLEDLYLRVSGNFGATKASMIYHDFSAQTGSADYGTELDAVVTHKTDFATYGVKFAAYDADTVATDTEKLWIWMSFGF